MKNIPVAFACAVAIGLLSAGALRAEEGAVEVAEGKQVSIEYTLKLDDGTTLDTTEGRDPLVFEVGAGQILPALEEKLVGMRVDQSTKVKVPPENGYGPHNPDAFQTVALNTIPEDARHVDAMLMAQSPQGQQRMVRVHEVRAEEIVLDYNHPLAGKTLHFDVKILGID
jgi:FKBP-type peptidyl-prolyl cis-trans isomerase SlyD